MRAGKTGVSANSPRGGEQRTDDRVEEREKWDTIVVVGKVCVRVRGRRAQGKNGERAGRDLYS